MYREAAVFTPLMSQKNQKKKDTSSRIGILIGCSKQIIVKIKKRTQRKMNKEIRISGKRNKKVKIKEKNRTNRVIIIMIATIVK